MNTTAGKTQLLLVEDDLKLRGLLETYLTTHGFEVRAQADGESALRKAKAHSFDLIILDVMLPGVDGYQVCRDLRRDFSGGIVMLTGRRGVRDQVAGLEIGADDYVTKPVDPAVLVARLNSLLRRIGRSRAGAGRSVVSCGSLTLDAGQRRASGPNGDLGLTQAEFDLAILLANRKTEVVEREVLARLVLGLETAGSERSVDTHMSRLRRKLERSGASDVRIIAVRGVGYFMTNQ